MTASSLEADPVSRSLCLRSDRRAEPSHSLRVQLALPEGSQAVFRNHLGSPTPQAMRALLDKSIHRAKELQKHHDFGVEICTCEKP